MKVTIELLSKYGSCNSGQQAFIRTFAQYGFHEVEIEKILAKCIEYDQPDYIAFLSNYMPFLFADIQAMLVINEWGFINSPSLHLITLSPTIKKAYAFNVSHVEISGGTYMRCFDDCRIDARENATVFAHGSATVYAQNNVRVSATDRVSVYAYDNSHISCDEHTNATLYDSAYIHALGDVRISANNESNGFVYGGHLTQTGKTVFTSKAYCIASIYDQALLNAQDNTIVKQRGGTVSASNNAVVLRYPHTTPSTPTTTTLADNAKLLEM